MAIQKLHSFTYFFFFFLFIFEFFQLKKLFTIMERKEREQRNEYHNEKKNFNLLCFFYPIKHHILAN